MRSPADRVGLDEAGQPESDRFLELARILEKLSSKPTILPMSKQRPREVRWPAQGHTASRVRTLIPSHFLCSGPSLSPLPRPLEAWLSQARPEPPFVLG